MKSITLIFLILLMLLPRFSKAQWFIGNDAGFISFDVRDRMLSPDRYENTIASAIHPALIYHGNKARFLIRTGKSHHQLESANRHGFRGENHFEGESYELDIEYFRKVFGNSNALRAFIGLSYNGHFSYYDQTFQAEYVSGVGGTHEMALFNFSINGLLSMPVSNHLLEYKAGLSVFNLGSRPKSPYVSDYFDTRMFPHAEYTDIYNSLVGYFQVSDRFMLKPEYKLRYMRYEQPSEMKMLKQSFLIGVYYKLW